MPTRNGRQSSGDKATLENPDNERPNVDVITDDNSTTGRKASPTAFLPRPNASPVLNRSLRDRESMMMMQVPTATLTPLARPALGIRVLPSSLVDPANLFSFGDMYLSDLSNLRQFEIVNLQSCPVRVDLKADIRKPFQASSWGFQTHNENLPDDDTTAVSSSDDGGGGSSFNRSLSKSSFTSSDTTFFDEGFNELFNQMGLIDSIVLEPNQSQRLIFSICVKFDTSSTAAASGPTADDSSDDERLHLHETSFVALSGRLLFSTTVLDSRNVPPSDATIAVPLQGNVCRSLLRLDVKELHFDDCVPGGSYVKDFTVWNRSEIPLVFRLVPSVAAHEKQMLTCSDYNTGYVLGESPFSVAAYSHMRVRVTYRPVEVGEQFFEILAQNLHDARNVKRVKIHAIASKEHHREGLSIREPNGSYLMGGSLLDFGDCYTGIPTSKALVLKNTTEAALHIELLSDRPKEITFELKVAQTNRARSTRPRLGFEEPMSPNEMERRLSLSPPSSPSKGTTSNGNSPAASAAHAALPMNHPSLLGVDSNLTLDSDDEPDEQDGEFTDEMLLDANASYPPRKRGSFEDDLEDIDDDMEFDGEAKVTLPPPPSSPKDDSTIVSGSSGIASKTNVPRTRSKRQMRLHARVKDLAESGVDSGASVCSSPERSKRKSARQAKASGGVEMDHASNFLVEALDLPPGVERTVLVWYCPPSKSMDESLDLKCCRLTKQAFRLNFRCYTIDGAWTGGGSTQRVHDRSLGKSLNVGARTCTSFVTLTPSTLHLGDCNIGEFKSSAVTLTNHSELPTVVKPSVISKVISTVPNDAITLGPKQSMELRIEIIPRKINPNYSRIVSVLNLKNKTNNAQVCVRSSNMDAHHVIYHSLFYKLVTPSKSAFLNFEHVAANSMSMKMFMIENITQTLLRLRIQSSDFSRVQLYCLVDANMSKSLATTPTAPSLVSPPSMISLPPTQQKKHALRRRRSIGCVEELVAKPKPTTSRLVELLKRKATPQSPSTTEEGQSVKKLDLEAPSSSTDTNEVLRLFETHGRWENEEEMVTLVRERVRRFHMLVMEKQIVPISTATEWNVRVPPKSIFPVLAVFTPKLEDVAEDKTRVEKYKVFITLPAGGNKPMGRPQLESYHPFDTRPSVRELLLKSRVCRSVLNVNQKNINFGRITTFSKSSKKVLIHNGSAIPLIYMVEKTGSISSGFLEIKDGAQGVIKPFGTRQVHFEFQPTLAGPFEEKLKIVNVQDVDNSVFITIKAKVVKRETFKLPQAGQPINVGTCLVGEKSEVFKVTIRNMSRKKREYVIEASSGFSVPSLRPTFQFSMDEIPAANITQAQEKKLDEELEKLEHKLRIAVTKKKGDKIDKLNSKISHVKALLSGEETTPLKTTAATYDSGNSDTESETESKHAKRLGQRRSLTSTLVATQLNQLHFTLEPEATGRIVGEVIFHQVSEVPLPKPSIRHRGQRRKPKVNGVNAAVPIYGTGKFIFYEQQNKDVMKELQYKADVFLRTPAGEAAYCRMTNKTLLPPVPHSKSKMAESLSVELKGDQLSSTRGYMLLLPVEEAPCDSQGWTVYLRARDPMHVELRWTGADALHDSIVFSAQLVDQEQTTPVLLPMALSLLPETTTTLHFKWSFSAKSGQTATAPLSRVLSPNLLQPAADLPAGQLTFQSGDRINVLEAMIVKAKPRSLVVDSERIDLGEMQLGSQAHSHFYVRNVSSHAIKFLVLASNEDSQIAIANATGRIEPGGTTMIRFTYTGVVSGKRSEHIQVRNLAEKLDFTALTVVVRVTRPVYVRIPELDPHMTGQLVDLNIGPCYVTSDDNGENHKFSKVRKLTLVSQVAETLLLSASSNLKTQCYVYQDASLQHDATNIVLPGMESLDLFIAVRPRLPADAFKTGVARDLFGGIRIQLFRDKEEERTLAAEFTVKFVGVAGASLASVSPRLLDFGTEENMGRLTRCKIHEGNFELTNLSKALPLRYRLYVSQGEDYSDDDTSLHVSLRHEKGDIPPGESAEIEFKVMAYTHGFFRRRILIENVFNPMNVNFVDVVLFVNNGTLAVSTLSSPTNRLDFGLVPLIRSDQLLGGAHSIEAMRRYRIYQPQRTQHTIAITNRSSTPLRLRPLSNLPLLFMWRNNKLNPPQDTDRRDTFALTIDGHNARELHSDTTDVGRDHANHHMLYYGAIGECPPQSTMELDVAFAPVACSCELSVDHVENGRLVGLSGFVALQSFDHFHPGAEPTMEATTLGIMAVCGVYGESKIAAAPQVVSLGKLGYGRSQIFQVEVKNLSEIPTLIHVGLLPPCLELVDVREATSKVIRPPSSATTSRDSRSLISLSQLAQRVTSPVYWEIDGYETATFEFKCLPECLTAGKHELDFSVYNANNPHNVQTVSVLVHVIAKYINVSLEPDCVHPAKPMETSVGYLAPMVVPPPVDPPIVGFLCTLVNIFDEELDVQLHAQSLPTLHRLVDLLVVSRTSNTPVTSLALAPGERIDLRITCRLAQPSAWNELPYSTNATGRFEDATPLGVVSIEAFCANVALSCSERIDVHGSFVLGQSFTVSTSRLPFSAQIITGWPQVSLLTPLSTPSFSIFNPSTTRPLLFDIESTPLVCPGQLFLYQETIVGDALMPKCIPDHGSVPPGESMAINVQLEETARRSSLETSSSSTMQLIVRDKDQSSSIIDLDLTGNDRHPIEVDSRLVERGLSSRQALLQGSRPATPALSTASTASSFDDATASVLGSSSGASSSSMPPTMSTEKNALAVSEAPPTISLRGCTPADNSTLENALYVIDVGQHTVRSGGDVEWEISLHVDKEVEYRLYLTDPNAKEWLQLSRTHGTVVTFQTIVLRFVRDVVGVYSTFVVLENCANPTDLKLIRVKLEVIADLQALRAMSKDKADSNLFRVLVSSYSSSKRQRRKSSEDFIADMSSRKLEIEYGDVFYDKLYHNHSLVLENFSSLSLDFMLSSNGRAHEVGFSMSPNSFNEISSVSLGAYGRLQVFLNFRPAPKSLGAPESPTSTWERNIEVYINCRLVKDFRETVFLKAICNYPQVNLHIALNRPTPGQPTSYTEPASPYFPSQPTFLGMGFTAPESILVDDSTTNTIEPKYLVMKNARSDANAHVAIRNDSMFFDVTIDHIFRAATGSPVAHDWTGVVKLEPSDVAVVRIQPNLELLRKNRQQWEHSVKEHIAFYNMKQFAEHYHVSLSFTPSNNTMSSFYVAPQLREAYPFSTLEDTIAKFLRQYHLFWKLLANALADNTAASVLFDLEHAIERVLPVSPRGSSNSNSPATLAQSYRALYFDFYYITDELIWYGIRSSAGRHAITLADLVYGVVFGHEVFGSIFNRLRADVLLTPPTTVVFANQRLDLRRLLLPWTRQLGYFLSFFPETQEATLALRQMYEPLKHFDLHR
ncbi:unnamed protein product [Aphanomyces euteiches]|uniref:HYDIN/VesB/CFA65-like Ig-like domain-containing protein n=1 Tax=Aphanomyces euteiches TaxID=100861 RepID=A0A6G0WUD1_9STRA|nr:hypothetical protein Ae201684_011618 [Aphanomyces euteiches]